MQFYPSSSSFVNCRCEATVQLVVTEDVLRLDYDSICEYVASVPDLE